MSASKWWKLTFDSSDAEELGLELLELGASGAQSLTEKISICFIELTSQQIEDFIHKALMLGATLVSKEEVAEENWLSKCTELWEELVIGKVRVIPVTEEIIQEHLDKNIIQIIPSTGFGTGHHVSTATVLKFLQEKEITSLNPNRALDLGTGSGILAIALAKLYGSNVIAVEIDKLACNNAVNNFQINHVIQNITLTNGTIESIHSQFELVVANIYAEILLKDRDQIVKRLTNTGFLILSGIALGFEKEVVEMYSQLGLHVVKKEVVDGWCTLLLKKN